MKLPNVLPNLKNNDGATPLHIACYCSNHDMIHFLLRGNYNVDIDLSDNNGDSVLHLLIDGREKRRDTLSYTNMICVLLWKNPFIILHRNNQYENVIDYAMKVQENDAFMSDDYDEEFWSIVTQMLDTYMHEARIHLYKLNIGSRSGNRFSRCMII